MTHKQCHISWFIYTIIIHIQFQCNTLVTGVFADLLDRLSLTFFSFSGEYSSSGGGALALARERLLRAMILEGLYTYQM